MSVQKKTGFTLVELLVVIAIIGVLVALLLPAVQAAREAARRIQCSNHLKQIGLAMHNYHDTFGSFPLGLNFQTPSLPGRGNRQLRGNGWSWSAMILPFVEQSSIYEGLDFTLRMPELPNRALVATPVSIASCPSAAGTPIHLQIGNAGAEFGFVDPGLAATNYVACAGSFVQSAYYNAPAGRRNGILYEDSNTKFRDITDGSSNTFLVGESVHYGGGRNMNFFWDPSWYGRYRHDMGGRADAPESIHRVAEFRMNQPSIASEHARRNSFSSMHPGGALFAMGDGAVRFISETIQHNQTSWAVINGGAPLSTLGVYQRLAARNSGQPVSEF